MASTNARRLHVDTASIASSVTIIISSYGRLLGVSSVPKYLWITTLVQIAGKHEQFLLRRAEGHQGDRGSQASAGRCGSSLRLGKAALGVQVERPDGAHAALGV